MIRLIYISILTCFIGLLSGCGAAQSVAEGTASVAKAMFIWDVKTVHLDLVARAELNVDDKGQSSAVVIRVYQLADSKSFEAAPYESLVNDDSDTLGVSLLASKEVILKPGNALSLDIPFDSKADYVGIIALVKEPDLKANNWRILLKRRDLNINKPREIIVNQFTLTLIEE